MTIQIEREAFGVWFKATRGNEPDDNNLITQFMLDAWLARSAQPSAPAWVAVETKLPTDSSRVLVVVTDEGAPITGRFLGDQSGWMLPGGRIDGCRVTHWQPLPPLPQEQAK